MKSPLTILLFCVLIFGLIGSAAFMIQYNFSYPSMLSAIMPLAALIGILKNNSISKTKPMKNQKNNTQEINIGNNTNSNITINQKKK